jgi:hypothetical protein
MNAQVPSPRRRWPWIVIAGVAVAAIVVVLAVHFASGIASPSASPTASHPMSTSTPVPDNAPTGCLGGASRDASMVLRAQSEAPHTSNGAVEVASAFTRWIQRYPYPSASDAATIQKKVLASKSFTDDLVNYIAGKPDLSGGIVPAGQTYYMSTVPGVWNLESASSNKAVVTIGTAFVVNGAVSSSLRSSITVTEDWQSGGWRIANVAGTRGTEQLFSIGHAFTGGC